MTGRIFGIKRMEIHDGDGLRTTVFLKGCTLKCIWCHNPEGISFEKVTAFFKNKCLGCGACQGVHDEITAETCPSMAVTCYGKDYSAKELVGEVLSDLPFFKNSGGGVTFSGGECMAQADFVLECARLLKDRCVSVFIDTCGNVPFESFEKIIPYTDRFLYDIKAIDPILHKRLTGRGNALILDNFKKLLSLGCDIEVRYPLIAGYNDLECEKISDFLSECGFRGKVKILRYHSLASSRYEALGMENTMPQTETLDCHMTAAKKVFTLSGIDAVTE